MKKLLTYILISCTLIFSIQYAWAVQIDVTEAIPGVCEGTPDADGVITCNVGKWFSVVSGMFGAIIKYFTFIASLAAVLFLVVNGILYSMSGLDAGLKDGAKKRIIGTLLWLIVLLLSWVILNAIAPWIYK